MPRRDRIAFLFAGAQKSAAVGVPQPVERTLISPPRCRMGTLDDAERAAVLQRSPVGGKYDRSLDRESAFERLAAQAEAAAERAAADAERAETSSRGRRPSRRRGNRQSAGEAFLKSTLRAFGSRLGREISRGLLGGLFGRKR